MKNRVENGLVWVGRTLQFLGLYMGLVWAFMELYAAKSGAQVFRYAGF
ncbi:MAG: hypothetical protein HQL54_09125 [Magnetococcales bacterium]|nr:hypothetical protein [Magnetococcales bacterium]